MTDRALTAVRFLLIGIVAFPLAASCSVDRLLQSAGPDGGSPPPVDPAVTPAQPDNAGQFRADGTTPVRTGETIGETGIVIAATLRDPEDDDSLRLQLEMRPVGTAFTGSPTHASDRVGNGERTSIAVSFPQVDTAYVWQVRSIDRAGRVSAWLLFNAAGGAFRVALPRLPGLPVELSQYEANGSTPIPVGGTVDERDVFLRARVPESNQDEEYRVEFEVRSGSAAFTGTPTLEDTDVRPGDQASVKFRAAAFTGYRWRVRACGGAGCSDWVEFGGNATGELDFYRDPFEDDGLGLSAEPRRR